MLRKKLNSEDSEGCKCKKNSYFSEMTENSFNFRQIKNSKDFDVLKNSLTKDYDAAMHKSQTISLHFFNRYFYVEP